MKTLTWRYMMRAEPFHREDADQRFHADVKAIHDARKSLDWNLGGAAAGEQITPKMREVRALKLPLRKNVYRQERIEDQRLWYANKSDWNGSAYRRVFSVTIAAQIGALTWAILMARDETLMLNLTGTLMGLAAALTAWGQVKQHQDLAQAYAQAAFELQSTLPKLDQATSEKAFSDFVGDAENAVSREHTMWLARRDV